MATKCLELYYRHWLIRCTAERLTGGWSAVVEVWRPARDSAQPGDVVAFTKVFDDAVDAGVEALEVAKRWIDARRET